MSHIDLELGRRQETADEEEYGSFCSSSSSDGDEGVSCCSHFYSTAGGTYEQYSLDPEISGEASSSGRASSLSEDDIEAEAAKVERQCRICHAGLASGGHEAGAAIQLGCSCKDDLGAAHKNCAETWFKIKGNKTCEICNSIAKNVACVNEAESVTEAEHNSIGVAPVTQPEHRMFWQGHRFLNFLLACMVFAFVVSWLFHFNVRS